MIKTFVQPISFSTPNTLTRDQTSLDTQVNTFIQASSKVIPVRTHLSTFTNAGTLYAMVVLDYNIKQG